MGKKKENLQNKKQEKINRREFTKVLKGLYGEYYHKLFNTKRYPLNR